MFVTVMKIWPMRVCVQGLVMPMWVRVACRRREIDVHVIVVFVVVPMTVHVLDRRMSMQVRMHAAEQEPGGPDQ
jgi:hypothetical protein